MQENQMFLCTKDIGGIYCLTFNFLTLWQTAFQRSSFSTLFVLRMVYWDQQLCTSLSGDLASFHTSSLDSMINSSPYGATPMFYDSSKLKITFIRWSYPCNRPTSCALDLDRVFSGSAVRWFHGGRADAHYPSLLYDCRNRVWAHAIYQGARALGASVK